MTTTHPFKAALLASLGVILLLFLSASHSTETPAPLPGDSLYQLDIPVTDQSGNTYPWAQGRGHVRVVSMFYTSCRYVCPLLVDTLKSVEHGVPEALRGGLHLSLISFDPARDDVMALASVATKRTLDPARWQLLRMDAEHVRELAAVLDIQYRQTPDGEFNHASRLVLLDAEGRMLARSDKLGVADVAFVLATIEALKTEQRAKTDKK